MTVVLSKIAIFALCGCSIFQNFIYETKIIMSEYVIFLSLCVCEYVLSMCGFSSTSKQMTLNIHSALNTVFRLESFSMEALVFKA